MERPFRILGVEHLGLVPKSFDASVHFFSDLLGLAHQGSEVVSDQKVETSIFDDGKGIRLELLKPTDMASPVQKFLDQRGSGVHHFALQVDNLEAALSYLAHNKVELIDDVPRVGAQGAKIAFVHPRSTGGLLLELIEM